MADAMTQEQASMAQEFYAARQRAREDAKPSQGEKAQKAAKLTRAAGTGAKAAGKGAQATGAAMEIGGKAMKAGGRATRQAGSSAIKAGAELSGTGLGAIAGVPIMIGGGALVGGGAAAEAGGTAAEYGGKAMKKGGGQLSRVGGQAQKLGKKAESAMEKIGPKKGQESKLAGQLQQMAAEKMVAKLSRASTPEEAAMRKAQIKRAFQTLKKIKKLVKGASATAVWTIVLLLFSYIKDYILGNIIYNGDPTGFFAKEEANFFGYKVTPLSWPEVMILMLVLWNGFQGFIIGNLIPILAILAIIAVAAGLANITEIGSLLAEIGTEAFTPILDELGLKLSS